MYIYTLYVAYSMYRKVSVNKEKKKKKNISRLFLSGKQRIPPLPSPLNESKPKCFSRFFSSPRKLEKIFSAKERTMERTMEIEQVKKKKKKKTYRFPQRILSSRPIIINPFLVFGN